jgi:outer membrane protein assembly factor BamB
MMRAFVSMIAMMLAVPAAAASNIYEFEATGFGFTKSYGPGTVAPVDPVSLRFRVTLDLAQSSWNIFGIPQPLYGTGLTVLDTSLPDTSGWDAVYAVDPFNGLSSLTVGDHDGPFCKVTGPSFCLQLNFDLARTPSFSSMTQNVVDVPSSSSYFTLNGRVSMQQVAAVPEPESWALLIAGFGLCGAVMRRRRATALA